MVREMTFSNREAFFQHCENVRSLSRNTLDAYRQDLEAFVRFLDQGTHECFDGELVLAYLHHLKAGRSQKQATIRRRLVTLRAFTNWQIKSGLLSTNPFADLDIDLRPPRRLPRPVDWVDVRTMLKAQVSPQTGVAAAIPAYGNEIHAVSRTTALAIKLMITTGVRVGELTRIKLSSISNDGYRIRIHGKGNKERNVYIGNPDLRVELQHIKWLATQDPHDGDFLLLNQKRRRLTEQALRRRLRLLAEDCKLDTRVTPHRFRHSAATFLIEEGVDIRFVQRLLGHSSIATTEIYTRVSDTALMQAINTADPLGKMFSEFT